ncbi:OmpA family protein [Alteromonas sp. ASW11-36]|uniref:OmpA family protein n=1 Tax=Alteromonas arenosi TaxID=3055817 RepID=A0ABT7SU26_9ALTE|nr:OmpA family protein [Alteromonas sp. ASW11-36]MDM7859052.1 OmpA family protein [Alteromonas sp. ASW11-36]
MSAADNDLPESEPQASDQLAQLRAIIHGRDGEHLIAAIQPHTRKLVGDVLIQALHDKQQSGEAINRVVAPMVEKTVERSVANHSEQFTSILYPLVGSLVRKAVSAFLSQFIERTNDIIENALSPKGLKWRFQAWQAGVNYSQFVAAQTYIYKVEQLLLIHRDTGLLLKSVSADVEDDSDADLISSMLSAINDFVADSFNPQNAEQQLGEVKTDDFTLLICHSPHALLVAAVTGNVPNSVRVNLQATLDEIHAMYREDLLAFQGDTLAFEVTDTTLRDSLTAEVKPEYEKKKRIPWFGWLFFVAILCGIGWWAWQQYEDYTIAQKVTELNAEPGILITELIQADDGYFDVTILRDSASISLERWLREHGLANADIRFNQQAFISVEPTIVVRKLKNLQQRFPEVAMHGAQPIVLSGELGWRKMQAFNAELAALPGIHTIHIDRTALKLSEVSIQAADQPAIQRQLFEQLVGEISRINIEFASGAAQLDDIAIENVVALKKLLDDALKTAQSLNLSANLIIIGASDATGSSSANQRLSLARANAVKTALINQGINVSQLFATGIGEINLSDDAVATRRVMFNLMYAETSRISELQGE